MGTLSYGTNDTEKYSFELEFDEIKKDQLGYLNKIKPVAEWININLTEVQAGDVELAEKALGGTYIFGARFFIDIPKLTSLTISAENTSIKLVEALCIRIKASDKLEKIDFSGLKFADEQTKTQAYEKIAKAVAEHKNTITIENSPADFRLNESNQKEKSEKESPQTSSQKAVSDDLFPFACAVVRAAQGGKYLYSVPKGQNVVSGDSRNAIVEAAVKNLARQVSDAIAGYALQDKDGVALTKELKEMFRINDYQQFTDRDKLFLTICAKPLENNFKAIEHTNFVMKFLQKAWQTIASWFYQPEPGDDFTKGYVNMVSDKLGEKVTFADAIAEARKKAAERSV